MINIKALKKTKVKENMLFSFRLSSIHKRILIYIIINCVEKSLFALKGCKINELEVQNV